MSIQSGNLKGKVHSFQSMGTIDGPGVRFVVFMQGCNLRCHCCHNPDTWNIDQSQEYTAQQVVARAERFKEYFGQQGGITVSGGEPLLQAQFVNQVFTLSHEQKINTCLDTSGSILNDQIKILLCNTDRVLLDIKYTDDEKYKRYVGCSMNAPLEFLAYLNQNKIPTTVRQVIIPSINDDDENIKRLKEIVKANSCVDKVELLPFRKVCQVKYDNLALDFPFKNISEPTKEKIEYLERLLKD